MRRLRRAQFNPKVSNIIPQSKGEDVKPEGRYKQSSSSHKSSKEDDQMLQELNIASEKVTFLKKIGEGTFGIVTKAKLTGSEVGSIREVALKRVKESDGSKTDDKATSSLLNELKLMRKLGHHPNVVELIGVCCKEGSHYIVTEYLSGGTLLEFLRRCRSTQGKPQVDVSEHELVRLALGVCQAMEHLTACELIHGDLSARNVLLSDQRIPKLTDFGLSRDFKGSRLLDAKSKGPQGKLPIKWMAIESLKHGIFTKKSDVWSFGIVMWEIITLGGSPYPGVPARNLLSKLLLGYRMEIPTHCSIQYYEIMKRCWEMEPSLRIGFTNVVQSLQNLLEEHQDRKNFIELATLCYSYPFMDLSANRRHTLDNEDDTSVQ